MSSFDAAGRNGGLPRRYVKMRRTEKWQAS
jgi:hypothetical protein